MKLILGCWVGLLVAAVSIRSDAQVPNTLWSHFEPLVYSRGGSLEGCGVRFVAMNADNRWIAGSVNSYYFKDKNNAFLTVKLAGGIAEADQLGSQQLTAGWVETLRFSTRDGFTVLPTGDPESILMKLDSLNTTAEGMTLWVEAVESVFQGFTASFSTGAGFDAVFRLGDPKNAGETYQQYIGCMKALLEETLR